MTVVRLLNELGGHQGDLFVQANGAVTAKSAVLMNSLDRELRKVTEGKFNLDDVANAVADRQQAITNTDFAQIVASLLGAPSDVLNKAGIANCHL